MIRSDAEEYTQALGQVAAGAWRQIALGERLGVPAALGISTREWVEQRLGGYVRLSIPERREAVKELEAEGHSQRQTANVLGVAKTTVKNDRATWADSAATGQKGPPRTLPEVLDERTPGWRGEVAETRLRARWSRPAQFIEAVLREQRVIDGRNDSNAIRLHVVALIQKDDQLMALPTLADVCAHLHIDADTLGLHDLGVAS